jgi:hypothetical protein
VNSFSVVIKVARLSSESLKGTERKIPNTVNSLVPAGVLI